MKLDLTDMLYALSFALDRVEAELLGIESGHCKKVACLSVMMGKEAGFNGDELRDFAGCCILHDNALTEFIHEELSKSGLEQLSIKVSDIMEPEKPNATYRHCIIGEQNISLLPFSTNVRDVILFHHENADGTGLLERKADEVPLKSQILHLADFVDMKSHLMTITEEEFQNICNWVREKCGSLFSKEAVELFLKSVNYEKIEYLQKKGLLAYLNEEIETSSRDYSDKEIHNIAGLFARIVDYKSEFTQQHSMGVANKAEMMARYYGFDSDKTLRYYFAGAMHDIGKLAISNDILEKPGKLTDGEFTEMKNHAEATRYILSEIKDIPDITEWASNHHEKLNGKGYPQGLTADELSFEEQLMACIDIYQALTERRPYKDGMPHEKAVAIMLDMAQKGELNEKIIHDLSTAVMAK